MYLQISVQSEDFTNSSVYSDAKTNPSFRNNFASCFGPLSPTRAIFALQTCADDH